MISDGLICMRRQWITVDISLVDEYILSKRRRKWKSSSLTSFWVSCDCQTSSLCPPEGCLTGVAVKHGEPEREVPCPLIDINVKGLYLFIKDTSDMSTINGLTCDRLFRKQQAVGSIPLQRSSWLSYVCFCYHDGVMMFKLYCALVFCWSTNTGPVGL
jgi:hypothetical protein